MTVLREPTHEVLRTYQSCADVVIAFYMNFLVDVGKNFLPQRVGADPEIQRQKVCSDRVIGIVASLGIVKFIVKCNSHAIPES